MAIDLNMLADIHDSFADFWDVLEHTSIQEWAKAYLTLTQPNKIDLIALYLAGATRTSPNQEDAWAEAERILKVSENPDEEDDILG
jgi:hypothetical protein